MNLTKPMWVLSDFNTFYLIYLGKCDCFFMEQLKGYPSEYPSLHLSMMQTFFFCLPHWHYFQCREYISDYGRQIHHLYIPATETK